MMPFWELTESQRACRLDKAIHLSQESSGYGIGVQKGTDGAFCFEILSGARCGSA